MTIVLDSGHGGVDSGATGNGLKEKDYTLLISQYLYDRFNELGVPVKLTRDSDETLTPNERVDRILNSFGNSSDVLVISSHLNAGGSEGSEVIYALRNSDELANNILNEISLSGFPVRKTYQRRLPSDSSKDYYFIHRNTGNTEPIIIEYGFIDNSKDAKRIKENYKKYAEAVVKAVSNTKGIKYKEPMTSDRYTVQRGDTLWSIAKKLGTTVNEIKETNNLSSNLLYINQELKVPNYDLAEDSNINYIVKKGDTLWSVASSYNISVSDLKKYNNLTSDFLQVGTVLNIPSSNQIITNDQEQEIIISEGNIYEIKPGDTLYSISKKFNVLVDDIINENNLIDTNLSIGSKILIPNNLENYITYTVQKGDSLWDLARRYNTTIDEIKKLNNLSSDVLQVGENIQIKQNTK